MTDATCKRCGGTGSIDDFGFYGVPCPDCNGTGEQPVAYEWTHEERPCRCTPEHRPHCHRCGGTGIYKSARLRRIDATTTHQIEREP